MDQEDGFGNGRDEDEDVDYAAIYAQQQQFLQEHQSIGAGDNDDYAKVDPTAAGSESEDSNLSNDERIMPSSYANPYGEEGGDDDDDDDDD